MMSSEEEVDCFGLYGDKLSKKAKRARQRVDAGEPRNSYSSIPNFSSRPSFFTGGLYGAFFSQNQQQFGIFGQGFGPKMLNELLGRQVKDAATPGDTMMTVDSASADGSVNFDCLNASSVIRRGLEEDGSPPPGDIAHHMLRDILQGRKKELLALEQELRVVNALGGTEPSSPDNNNSINNNNNNELKNGVVNNNGDVSDDGGSGVGKTSMVNGTNESDSGDDEPTPSAMEEVNDKHQQTELEDVMAGGGSDSEPASPTPSSDNKDDTDDNPGNKDNTIKTEQLELKRARVENIVSSMRSSPSLPSQVNGCKKRKRYHPQQHDNSAAERYAVLGINMNMNMLMDDDDDDEIEPNEIRQKRVEKDALKNQLRTMQEQLAEMQQKYVQLCTRMDQESECQDNDDASSDMEQDASNLTMPDKPVTSTSVSTPVKENITSTSATTPVSQPIMSPAVSKMMPSKLHPHTNPSHLPPQHLPIPPNFNGALSLLQQQVLQEQHGPHGPLPHHHLHPHAHSQIPPHHALSNAAAMYLGVSHKLYMEQEARLAKEAAIAAEQQHQHQQHLNQQHHSHQQHMMSHHQQQQTQPSHQQQQAPQQQPMPQQQQQGSQTPHSQPSTPHPQTPSQSSTQTQPTTPQQTQHPQVNQSPPQQAQHAKTATEFTERLNMLRNHALAPPVSGSDLEGLADVLKTEITSSLSNLIDSIMSRFVQQRRFFGKQSEAAAVAAEQLNKDLLLASQLLDRKSPRSKVIDRGNQGPPERTPSGNMSGSPQVPSGPPRVNGTAFPSMAVPPHHQSSTNNNNNSNPENNINTINLPHVRPSPNQAMFQPPKPPTSSMNSVAAAALYNTMSSMGGPHTNPFCVNDSREGAPEQNEALSLVVAPKKKRHKVTDTRITPRTVSRILAQDGIGAPPQGNMDSPPKFNMIPSTSSNGGDSPPPRPYHPPPPPMLPVSLPTSVAIPNPSLHESQVFSPYSPFYGQHHQGPHIPSASPPGMAELRESPPLHPPTLLHPALLAAAQHGSPDYSNMRTSSAGLGGNDSVDRSSDCNSGDGPYDGITPTDSPRNGGYPMTLSYGLTYEASSLAYLQKLGYVANANDSASCLPKDSLTELHSSTLTPMHLRKAKLMFFWVRYPSSAVLKMYFPDIKFNKNNTAQLVKWFSNFREFYYIQMEKYARQAVSEGIKSADDLHVSGDCEIYRVLNLHYNRNNHIEVWGPQVPPNFRYVVEQTLKEFFKAIQGGKDSEQSWKKSIYKIISRMDDPVPEYFKSPNFLEQLE
ncbi:homeobox protein prospero-like isoform X1 [Homalodisca vitripennis]|nr:homeobox protein prospero-like isoform X1 [Homalodisca vitripennis]XP_046658659.1 homeobox protein prospero-like isoform X1 [Homalodisca vitripennis]